MLIAETISGTSGLYTLIVPSSATNGAGENTSIYNCYAPVFRAWIAGGALVGATLTLTTGSGFNTFNFASLTSGGDRLLRVQF
jgi:hypothetical protein